MSETAEKPEVEEGKEGGKSGGPALMIIAFIAVVIVVETVLFLVMVPSAEDVARLAEKRLVANVEASMEEAGEEKIEDNEEFKEISLGTYSIMFTPPGQEQRKHRVEFELVGVVLAEDEQVATEMFAEREGRFKDRLLAEVRNASIDELEEMGLIKRRVFATSNELIQREDGTPILREIAMPRYAVVEM
jgi:hypothetical protein